MSASTRILVASAAVAAFGLIQPVPSYASFHLMQIEQVIGGVNGDTSAQAIQLRMRAAGQNLVSQARLRAWDAAGVNPVLVVDMTTNVTNFAAGSRVLVCASGFAANTTPAAVCDFTMTNLIPPAYLAAGTLTFEDDFGTIYWRLSWGGASYTGSGAVTAVPFGNDDNGTANPPFGGALPSTSLQALQFSGLATDTSTTNLAQYVVTVGAAVFTNNANTNFTVIPPAPTGACCVSGNCAITTQANCSGTWNNGVSCTSNPCPQPTGACCDDSTGMCSEPLTQITCTGSGRRYGGNNSTCGDINPQCIPPPTIPIGLELIAGVSQTAAGPTMSSPLGITDAGDGTGRLFIHDQIGLIRVLDAGGNLLPDPMLDISALMPPLGLDFGGGFPIFDERGLLGLAFHPDFATCPSNGCAKFYIQYSKPRTSTGSEPCDLDPNIPPAPNPVPPSTGKCHEEVVAQYTMLNGDPLSNVADPSSEVILFRWDKPQFNHNAGYITFGPDGMLYFSTGDGGGANDGLCDSPPSHGPGGNGQNIEKKLGKMIRIDADGTDGPGGLYGIPPTNPFAGATPGLDEIYAYGFRNPFRFSFDDGPGGDNGLYVADVGQDLYEEVDNVVLGGNYGWAIREGAHCFVPPCTPLPGCADPSLIDPISEYTHAEGGTAIIGGYVYRGSAYPQLVGKYVYGDDASNFFSPSGRLYYFDLTGPEAFVRKEFFIVPNGAPFGQFLKGFGRDANGEIYVTASGVIGPNSTVGVIYKIVPPPPPNTIAWRPFGRCTLTPFGACTVDADCAPSMGTCKLWPNDDPEATTRSLRFRVTGPGTPSKADAIKVTMIDLQHPNPRNSPTSLPANYTTFDTRSNGVCSGGQFNGHHCDTDADCVGTTNGTCSSLAACTAAGEGNGCARWVGKPGTFYESEGPPQSGPYRAARLQCTPFYWDWKSEPDGGLITVVGAEIVPSSEYSVQDYAVSCIGMEATCVDVSSPVTMYTRRSGDVDVPYNPGSTPLTNQPNASDIAQLVNKFKNLLGAPVKARAQLQPNLPELNASINALDIVAVVDAFKGLAYAFSGPCPCPSTQTCGATCTGCAGMCVKTCIGGDNAGQPCIGPAHCPSGACSTTGTCRDKCGRCN